MELEIKQIIEKSLPAQVGDVLKKRLIEAESNEAKILDLEDRIKRYAADIKSLTEQVESYGKFQLREKNLFKREQDCLEKERGLEVQLLKHELKTEQDKSKFAQDLAMGLVRNSTYKRSILDTKNGPNGVDNYGNVRYDTHTVNSTETKETE
jgi:hypothetical protein